MATLLLPMQEGEIWRVQIVWLNGHVNYFGKFTSEKEAVAWIDAHPRLTGTAQGGNTTANVNVQSH
jgi:hypothetical protein